MPNHVHGILIIDNPVETRHALSQHAQKETRHEDETGSEGETGIRDETRIGVETRHALSLRVQGDLRRLIHDFGTKGKTQFRLW